MATSNLRTPEPTPARLRPRNANVVTPPVPAPASDDRLLMPATEAARKLGVSPWTVYRMVDRGELRGRRIGRCVRVEVASLMAWLQRS